MTATNEQLIGRDEVNDLEAILSVSNHDSDAVDHHVDSHFESLFTWNYDKGTRARLERLYEKAKTSQWNGQTDLPWEIEVDQEAVVEANRALMGANGLDIDVTGTPFEHWSDAQWLELGCESQNCGGARRAAGLHARSCRDHGSDRSGAFQHRVALDELDAEQSRLAIDEHGPAACQTPQHVAPRLLVVERSRDLEHGFRPRQRL